MLLHFPYPAAATAASTISLALLLLLLGLCGCFRLQWRYGHMDSLNAGMRVKRRAVPVIWKEGEEPPVHLMLGSQVQHQGVRDGQGYSICKVVIKREWQVIAKFSWESRPGNRGATSLWLLRPSLCI